MVIPVENKDTEEIFETIMTENFPQLMSDTKTEIQETQQTPNRINVKNPSIFRHITFKLQKVKDKES